MNFKEAEISQPEMNRLHEEALEINALVDEMRREDETLTAQMAAEKIIKSREISDRNKEVFGRGWGEEIAREVIASHPAVAGVEKPAKETDEKRATDALVIFRDKGALGVQITLSGFEERGDNDLKDKLREIMETNGTLYRNQRIPLTMIRGGYRTFINAFAEWEARGRQGSPADYIPRKDVYANHLIKIMADVLAAKHKISKHPEDLEWAGYLKQLYDQRELDLAQKTKSAPRAA